MKNKELVLAACKCGRPFAEKVAHVLREHAYKDIRILDTTEKSFPNSEIKTMFDRSIRGSDFFLIQDCETREFDYSANDSIAAMETALDAAHHSDVGRKTLITLSFPYARQDKAEAREGVTASRLAQKLEDIYNINNIIYMDVHNEATAGFFRKAKVNLLKAIVYLTDYAESLEVDKFVYADAGGSKRVEDYAEILQKDMVGFQKRRDNVTGDITSKLIGNVENDTCLIVEDMIDTGGTIYNAVNELVESGARGVYVMATHGLLNGKACERMSELYKKGFLKKVICTDSVYHSDKWKESNLWYDEVSVASYVAKVIHRIHNDGSLSELLDYQKYFEKL